MYHDLLGTITYPMPKSALLRKDDFPGMVRNV